MNKSICIAAAISIMASCCPCSVLAQVQTLPQTIKTILSSPIQQDAYLNRNSEQVFEDIDSRRQQLADRVEKSLALGRLSQVQASEYRHSIYTIAQDESGMGNGLVTFAQAAILSNRLGYLSAKLDHDIVFSDVAQPAASPGLQRAGRPGSVESSLSEMQTHLVSRLSAAWRSKQISQVQYDHMSADLGAVREQLLAGKGDPQAQHKMRFELLKLQDRLNDNIAGVPSANPM